MEPRSAVSYPVFDKKLSLDIQCMVSPYDSGLRLAAELSGNLVGRQIFVKDSDG